MTNSIGRTELAIHSMKIGAAWTMISGLNTAVWGLLAYFVEIPILHVALGMITALASVFFAWAVVEIPILHVALGMITALASVFFAWAVAALIMSATDWFMARGIEARPNAPSNSDAAGTTN